MEVIRSKVRRLRHPLSPPSVPPFSLFFSFFSPPERRFLMERVPFVYLRVSGSGRIVNIGGLTSPPPPLSLPFSSSCASPAPWSMDLLPTANRQMSGAGLIETALFPFFPFPPRQTLVADPAGLSALAGCVRYILRQRQALHHRPIPLPFPFSLSFFPHDEVHVDIVIGTPRAPVRGRERRLFFSLFPLFSLSSSPRDGERALASHGRGRLPQSLGVRTFHTPLSLPLFFFFSLLAWSLSRRDADRPFVHGVSNLSQMKEIGDQLPPCVRLPLSPFSSSFSKRRTKT